MCGITGFIGESKNPNLSFRLISSLFKECETRGVDAAGHYGIETGNGNIFYHKEPIKASEFVKKAVWKDLAHVNLNLLLVHARGASQGSGPPADNRNNHPFTSTCKSIGLVHNGRIPDSEYDVLSKRYEVASKCDSEILLRIFEAGKNYSEEECSSIVDGVNLDSKTASRLMGLRDIWSFIDKGHMAVSIGERVDNQHRRLFLFRNKWRSLWLADVRKDLGQVFFCSTPEIWNDAFRSSGANRSINGRVKLIELPTEELWVMHIGPDEPIVSNIKKYDIAKNGRTLWKPEGELIPIIKGDPVADIITKLDEDEQIKTSKKDKEKAKKYTYWDEEDGLYIDDPTTPSLQDFNASCEQVRKLVSDLESDIERQLHENITKWSELKEIMNSLEQTELDLEGTIKMWVK